MPDFSQPVSMNFIIEIIAVIFVIIGVGIVLVKKGKKSRTL
jgi:predicted permease